MTTLTMQDENGLTGANRGLIVSDLPKSTNSSAVPD